MGMKWHGLKIALYRTYLTIRCDRFLRINFFAVAFSFPKETLPIVLSKIMDPPEQLKKCGQKSFKTVPRS